MFMAQVLSVKDHDSTVIRVHIECRLITSSGFWRERHEVSSL